MHQKSQFSNGNKSAEYLDLGRDELLLAISAAQSNGYRETVDALIDLVFVVDEIEREGGNIKYRVTQASDA